VAARLPFEAWLHADVPRVGCSACGKTTQMPVPWAREGICFTLLFEALALSMCQGLAVRQAAQMLRVRDKHLWRRIDHYVGEARRKQDMSKITFVGIDETSLRKGHQYVTVVHDLDEKRLLFGGIRAGPGGPWRRAHGHRAGLHGYARPSSRAHAGICPTRWSASTACLTTAATPSSRR
jgi:hypothetical protein